MVDEHNQAMNLIDSVVRYAVAAMSLNSQIKEECCSDEPTKNPEATRSPLALREEVSSLQRPTY
jgi:hypothetical protein